MTVKPQKTPPKRAEVIRAADGAHRGAPWAGSVSGAALNTDSVILFVDIDEIGAGPDWHVHPYDEVFILTEGRARFTVGDESFDVEQGDVVMGPAAVPHKYKNLGPGKLRSIDIHLSRTWIQTDLRDPDS
ncbi:cupin domain-containing protein [Sulfitobacter sp. HNIBRBA3233]|uniref:cupin domain-containing protein n=1 Tax=Sulfitobacter marinivivus TaxID=3158558 RepID=UPI0032DFD272